MHITKMAGRRGRQPAQGAHELTMRSARPRASPCCCGGWRCSRRRGDAKVTPQGNARGLIGDRFRAERHEASPKGRQGLSHMTNFSVR